MVSSRVDAGAATDPPAIAPNPPTMVLLRFSSSSGKTYRGQNVGEQPHDGFDARGIRYKAMLTSIQLP